MVGFDATNENAKGVDSPVMMVAIDNLDQAKEQFTIWNNNLVELKDLVVADWLGGASEQFEGSYQALADTMYQMINYAMQLRDISQESVELYGAGDNGVAEDVYSALKI